MEKPNKILPSENSENKILLALELLDKNNLEDQLTFTSSCRFF